MDLRRAIRELYVERDRLVRAIAQLEAIRDSGATSKEPAVPSRRGRKSMGPAERREVSERMKQYWKRRKSKGKH